MYTQDYKAPPEGCEYGPRVPDASGCLPKYGPLVCSGTGTTFSTNKAIIIKTYQEVLARNSDDAGLAYWVKQIYSGTLKIENIAPAMACAAKDATGPDGTNAKAWILKKGFDCSRLNATSTGSGQICPMFMSAPPPFEEGQTCEYVNSTQTDANGCQKPGEWSCKKVMCPQQNLLPAQAGCEYVQLTNEKNCKVSELICAKDAELISGGEDRDFKSMLYKQTNGPGIICTSKRGGDRTCQYNQSYEITDGSGTGTFRTATGSATTSTGSAPTYCNFQVNGSRICEAIDHQCPTYSLDTLQAGCSYVSEKDATGCNKPKVICTGTGASRSALIQNDATSSNSNVTGMSPSSDPIPVSLEMNDRILKIVQMIVQRGANFSKEAKIKYYSDVATGIEKLGMKPAYAQDVQVKYIINTIVGRLRQEINVVSGAVN
jgi:hypothetical protein